MAPEFYTRNFLSEFIAKTGSEIGAHTYGQPTVRWWGENARLKIGRYCSIADGVTILLGGNHRSDWISTYPFSALDEWPEAHHIEGHPATNGDVVIGNDVWLGLGCTILSGVTIGDGAVIGAQALVTRNVPPYTIVGGNPAKVIRQRFEPDVIAMLTSSKWWDLPEDTVRGLIPLLMSGNVEAFRLAVGQPRESSPPKSARLKATVRRFFKV